MDDSRDSISHPDGHSRPGIILWRYGACQEHAFSVNASIRDFLDDGCIVGDLRL